MSSGDTAWVLTATALVLFMTPGLAFFYGGMVRAKHVLAMLMQNVFAMGLIGVLWVLVGFSLAFGRYGDGGFIGGFEYIGLRNVGAAPMAGMTIPFILFAAYQMTFAIITPALITGATADRLKFGGYAVFIGLWMVFVYAPIAHWVFAGGWLAQRGALDFAGGAVVHVNAGAAALAVVLVVGRRANWPREAMPPHSLPLTMLGTGILWFGWFGFNAGSALAANGVAAQATMNTTIAASAAMLGWLAIERAKDGHATTLGAASGAVAGLVAITPCAGYVNTLSALLIGFVTGGVCFLAISLKFRFGYDDALDVIGVHLVGGLFGSVLLGLFATKAVNLAGANGLFYGDASFFGKQLVAVVMASVYAFLFSYMALAVINKITPVRTGEQEEEMGLDAAEHGEEAYIHD
jgi:Amt family ammonium transporter